MNSTYRYYLTGIFVLFLTVITPHANCQQHSYVDYPQSNIFVDGPRFDGEYFDLKHSYPKDGHPAVNWPVHMNSIVGSGEKMVLRPVNQAKKEDKASRFSVSVGLHYAIPDADITLNRGDRKTVEHTVSPSFGIKSDIRYKLRKKRYLFASLELNSFEYSSNETFGFNGAEYPADDQMLNANIRAGIGWQFPIRYKSAFYVQPSLVYIVHNNELSNFPSERILPDDLTTVNITTIDWDLFNSFGIGIGGGYQLTFSENWSAELSASFVFTYIEGDIVDSPTSNDFDKEPNMSRDYIINSLGINIRRSF